MPITSIYGEKEVLSRRSVKEPRGTKYFYSFSNVPKNQQYADGEKINVFSAGTTWLEYAYNKQLNGWIPTGGSLDTTTLAPW